MRRRFPGLHQASQPAEVSDGLYLVRVRQAQYRRHAHKPFYAVQFAVLEPKPFAGNLISGRIYCTEKALWKLSWFLRDFGYDAELLGGDELDERQLLGLTGVLKITHTTLNGASLLNFDGFAQAVRWEELSGSGVATSSEEPSYDLQLYPDQPLPCLPPPVSASLSGRLAGKGHPGGDALRAGI